MNKFKKALYFQSSEGVVVICPHCKSVLTFDKNKWVCLSSGCKEIEQKHKHGYLYIKKVN